MDPLNNGQVNNDFNYEQNDMYNSSNVSWRAVHYTGRRGQTPGGHLAPAPTLDMSFSRSQTSFLSSVSPSSIGSAGGPAQLSGNETGANYDFEAIDWTRSSLIPPEVPLSQVDYAGQWPTIGSLDAGHLQMPLEPQDAVHSPLEKVNQLKNDLQLWDSLALQVLPELDYSQLIDLRSLIKTTFCKLDTSIQAMLDLGAPNIPSPRDRYLCKLCTQGNRKVYGTRGTFRRHVSLTHQAEHKYYCPFDACSFSTPRRDKFRGHLQVKHGSSALSLLNKGCLDNLARPCSPPKKCGLCPKQVTTWKRYFECVAKHCRLPGGSSTYTSASQSRRGSGNTGGDGADFGGQQFFGPGSNDGSGFPPPSSFEGDYMGGRDLDLNNMGQQFSFHAASLSQHNRQADTIADTIGEAEQSPPPVANACARTRPDSEPCPVLNEDDPKHLSPVCSPTSLRDYHRTLNSTLKEDPAASTKRNSSLDSFQQLSAAGNTPHSSDGFGRRHISNTRPRPADENPRKNQSRNLEKLAPIVKPPMELSDNVTFAQARLASEVTSYAPGIRKDILIMPSGLHALDLPASDNVPDGVAIARTKLPLFKTEVQMQLLDDALDSANPDLTYTIILLRKRSHMLQMRLRVIVKLLKLKTTVANLIESEAPEADEAGTSEFTPDFPDLIEFTFDLPILDDTLSPSQLWSMMISNAGMIVGSFASTTSDIPNLNDGRDALQFFFMMLIHILMKLARAPIRPVNTTLVE
ncbi:hypothetical protein CNMCM6106_003567 [Aspergillus hiratsukae]|uniref:C2H2-type domain-containing protein n=1 Tax=Aspergillus hiratsukae TaxID=1194566 RepID=A0A8H6PPG0_9EURO|nr:hypothetical protein CNMCM6106_003567 [Aspergillus hiratsukae]